MTKGLAVVLALAASAAPVRADDRPQWRGPHGNRTDAHLIAVGRLR